MKGFAKSILIVMLLGICLMIFNSMVAFFPWYMTLVVETFNLSQIVASDNYLKDTYYYDTLDNLQDKPIYRDRRYDIEIEVLNSSNSSAIGSDNEEVYYYDSESNKPYRQRGEPLSVKISAVYPFSVTLWGSEYYKDLPVSFELTVIGLKHYKDLEYYRN